MVPKDSLNATRSGPRRLTPLDLSVRKGAWVRLSVMIWSSCRLSSC